jgi:membrane protease subunit HflK
MAPETGPLVESLESALRLLRWIAVGAVLAIVLSGVTVVGSDEVAVRLRFGRLVGSTRADQVHGPGLLVALPYLVDEVVRVPVKRVHEIPVDALAIRTMVTGDGLDVTTSGYALTGDQNIVHLEAVLKYQIADPVAWAFEIASPEAVVRDAAVAALTRTLGEMAIDAVMADGQGQLAARALGRAQARLDEGGQWVRLLALELTRLRPPARVAPLFDDVQSAFVERKTRVEEARGYREQMVPRAAAEAEVRVREAEAAEAASLAQARGAAAAFAGIRDEHRRNATVVRQRLYREALEGVLASVGSRVLVPPGSDAGRILVPAEAEPAEWAGPGG